ncbi:AbrB/MazE/SpoVT family DNA-binding domain-containing protein [Acidithiobacillus sulfurivorans]
MPTAFLTIVEVLNSVAYFLIFSHHSFMDITTQISPRGQITLPADTRKRLGLKPGDTLLIHLEGGRIILDPAVVLPVEIYDEERIAAFAEASAMTQEELMQAKARWDA